MNDVIDQEQPQQYVEEEPNMEYANYLKSRYGIDVNREERNEYMNEDELNERNLLEILRNQRD